MIEGSVSDCSPGGSNGQRTTLKLTTGPIAILGSFVDDLIKGGENIVGKLNFCDGGMSSDCSSDGESDDALLGERSVKDSIYSILLDESGGAPEDSSELDVFSENFGAVSEMSYVWSVSSAMSMAELTAWKRLSLVLSTEAGISFP